MARKNLLSDISINAATFGGIALKRFMYARSLASGTNLNNLPQENAIYSFNNSVAKTLVNYPSDLYDYGTLVTMGSSLDTTRGFQMLIPDQMYALSNFSIAVRSWYGSNWTNWNYIPITSKASTVTASISPLNNDKQMTENVTNTQGGGVAIHSLIPDGWRPASQKGEQRNGSEDFIKRRNTAVHPKHGECHFRCQWADNDRLHRNTFHNDKPANRCAWPKRSSADSEKKLKCTDATLLSVTAYQRRACVDAQDGRWNILASLGATDIKNRKEVAA